MGCRSFFCFKQETAYEVRISDWSSDVCSSDLAVPLPRARTGPAAPRQWCHGSGGRRSRETSAPGAPRTPPSSRTGDRRRSEERRLGKDCVSPWRSRWTPYHQKNIESTSSAESKTTNKHTDHVCSQIHSQ